MAGNGGRSLGKAGYFLALGFEVSGIIVACSFFGYWIDEKLGSGPIAMVALVLLGSVGAFIRMLVMLKRLEKRGD